MRTGSRYSWSAAGFCCSFLRLLQGSFRIERHLVSFTVHSTALNGGCFRPLDHTLWLLDWLLCIYRTSAPKVKVGATALLGTNNLKCRALAISTLYGQIARDDQQEETFLRNTPMHAFLIGIYHLLASSFYTV
jgi:hypothetical protein